MVLLRGRDEFVSRRYGWVCDPSERYYWLHSPVCLERRSDQRGGASLPHLLVKLACKAGCAFSRILGIRPR